MKVHTIKLEVNYMITFFKIVTIGLYLTGQDVFLCGFAGALFGGLLSAASVLGRNVYSDLTKLYKEEKESKIKVD